MNRLYIVFITLLLYCNNCVNSWQLFDSKDIFKKLQDSSTKDIKNTDWKRIVEKKSSSVVLIYTISDKGKDKYNFYNSAIQPRINKTDYKYGVTNGVIVSPDGIVVTTYTATMNSDKYIVVIDSEKNQDDESYEINGYVDEINEDKEQIDCEDDIEEDSIETDAETDNEDEEENEDAKPSYTIDNLDDETTDINSMETDAETDNEDEEENKDAKPSDIIDNWYDDNTELNSLETEVKTDNEDIEEKSNNSTIIETEENINKSNDNNSIKTDKASINQSEQLNSNRKKSPIVETRQSDSELINLSKELELMNKKLKKIKLKNKNGIIHNHDNCNNKINKKKKSNIQLDNNTYYAEVLTAIPELNIVVLKLQCNKSEKFNHFNIINDSFFQTKTEKETILLDSAIVVGKCRGEHYVHARRPYNSKNKFDITKSMVGSIAYKTIDGLPTLILYTPMVGSVFPENQGGAIIRSDGELIGIPCGNWSISNYKNNKKSRIIYYDCFSNIPQSYAIPASTIKKILSLISLKLPGPINPHCGITVEKLESPQKKFLKAFFDKSRKDLKNEYLKKLQNTYGFENYSSISKYINNGQLGVAVSKITSESPAEKANIHTGDILLNLNTECITKPKTFYNLEADNIDKSVINLTLLRKNELVIMEVKR